MQAFIQALLLMPIFEQRLSFLMFYFMKNDHKIIVKYRRGRGQRYCKLHSALIVEPWWGLRGQSPWKILPIGSNTGFEFGQRYECIKFLEHHKRQKMFQSDRSFVSCFMFSLDKCAFFQRWALLLGRSFFEYGFWKKNYVILIKIFGCQLFLTIKTS